MTDSAYQAYKKRLVEVKVFVDGKEYSCHSKYISVADLEDDVRGRNFEQFKEFVSSHVRKLFLSSLLRFNANESALAKMKRFYERLASNN